MNSFRLHIAKSITVNNSFLQLVALVACSKSDTRLHRFVSVVGSSRDVHIQRNSRTINRSVLLKLVSSTFLTLSDFFVIVPSLVLALLMFCFELCFSSNVNNL